MVVQPGDLDQEDSRPIGLSRLASAIAAFPGRRFAVVDGAHFADLPALFASEQLRTRSLYLGHADDEIERAGPWLVALDQRPDAIRRVFAIVEEKPAAVFWSCAGAETILFRHLRTLNMARIPSWAADGEPSMAQNGTQEHYETVFFRHFDPSVLGALLPVLEAAQFARLLGPADEIAFHAVDYGGLKRAVREREWPPPSPGLLTILSEQMVALSRRRLAASHNRIASYLRRFVPEIAPKMTANDLSRFVEDSDASGRDLGIRTEAGHCRWAYLMMMSEGRILQQPDALAFIRYSRNTPDDQVKALMGHLRHYFRYDAHRDLEAQT